MIFVFDSPKTPIFVPRIEKLEEGEPTNVDIRYVDDVCIYVV
jgi:hypothetical protein